MSIRQLGTEDSELYRVIRLRALLDARSAFGSTYEREAAFDATVWEERLAHEGNPVFVFQDHGAIDPVGLVVASPDAEKPEEVHLLSLWVAPDSRGKGIGGELVRSVVGWAEQRGARKVRLHVTEGNEEAAGLYANHGFAFSGLTIIRERDGMTELEMTLDLTSR